jgi:hypothetical protein
LLFIYLFKKVYKQHSCTYIVKSIIKGLMNVHNRYTQHSQVIYYKNQIKFKQLRNKLISMISLNYDSTDPIWSLDQRHMI